jgi:4-amino-4-deoxy-L-arabinose transferase-like glycosyltransferase
LTSAPASISNASQKPLLDRRGTPRRKLLPILIIFFVALGVRLLCWHDARFETTKVQTSVTNNYKSLARLLIENGAGSFFDPRSTTNNPDLLGHPPGYPIFLAALYRTFGESDTTIQIVQMLADSLAAVLILLIAAELFPFVVAVIAGAMAAFSPQFSWNSMLLLPDTLAVLPILAAVWIVVRNPDRRSFVRMLGAGALIGISCWLRANAFLLAPFLILLIPFLIKRGSRLRLALALIAGLILIIAPLTIRNAVVFHRFIPVSLGAGQTLIEGIADYDTENKFGLPKTDMELIAQESESSGNPAYANSLFSPDGVERDRARLRRGLDVIRQHPFWFAGVMARRAASMIKLERTPLTSTAPVAAGWTYYPHLIVRLAQKLFITAVVFPLVLIGVVALTALRRWRDLAVLLVVPCYYFCVQSALHTEYRYVLAIDYFLFAIAALAIYRVAVAIRQRVINR